MWTIDHLVFEIYKKKERTYKRLFTEERIDIIENELLEKSK